MDYTTSMLYGKASNGSIKQWQGFTQGAQVIIEHGKQGGKIAKKATISVPKNVGRANETTGAEQAILEVKAKWTKQSDKDYRESIEDIPTSTLPNLAHKFQDKKHTLDYNKGVGGLAKLDGVRVTIFRKNGELIFQSRGGKEYPIIQEIAAEVENDYIHCRDNVYVDGELYCHGMCLEDITSAVKKHNENTHKIELHIFDYIEDGEPLEWQYRHARLIAYEEYAVSKRVFCVDQVKLFEESDVKWYHDEFIKMGYEGLVIRPFDGMNSFGNRTTDFLKYKERKDAEFKVVNFVKDKNGCALPICEIEVNGVMETFKAPMVGTQESLRDLWACCPSYVGEWLTVEFEAYSKYGIPAKPKGKMFRCMDEDGNPSE